jgi:hypothetical protein
MWIARAAAVSAAVSFALLMSAIAEEYPLRSNFLRLRVGLPMAVTLVLLYEMHSRRWGLIGRAGFTAALLSTMAIIDPFAITTAIGWWVLPFGLLMAGGDAMRKSLPRPAVFLLPLGAILLVRIPATFLAGEYVGGFAAMVAFGTAWLVLASLLIFEEDTRRTERD